MLKNAIAYECFTAPPSPDELEQAMAQRIGRPLTRTEASRTGWAPVPCTGDERLSYHAGGAGITLLNLECLDRDLKRSHIMDEVEARAEALRVDRGRGPTRAEKSIIKEQVIEQMIPRAFVNRRRSIMAWVYSAHAGINYIIVDESNRKTAERGLQLLRETLGSLQVVPLSAGDKAMPPRRMMTAALQAWGGPNAADMLPDDAYLGDSCKMVDPVDADRKVTFKDTGLLVTEVGEALAAGYVVNALELVFKKHLTATLTDDLTFKRIHYADDVRERMNDSEEWVAGAIIGVNAIVTVLADVIAMHQLRE